MAAADQQREVRRLELGIREPRAVHVAGEVGDADDRQAAGERGARRVHRADDQAARQARSPGDGHGIDRVPAAGHRRERRVDHGGEPLEVCARRELGNHPAVHRMQGDLRRHHRGADLAAVGEHRRRGLVAGGFDGEEIQADGYSIEGPPPTPATSSPLRIAVNPRLNSGAWMLSLHMITASSPLSV